MQKENPFFFSFPMATIFLKTTYDNLDNSYFCMPTSDTSIRRIIGRLTDYITIVVQSCPKLSFLHIIPQKKNSAPLWPSRWRGAEEKKNLYYIAIIVAFVVIMVFSKTCVCSSACMPYFTSFMNQTNVTVLSISSSS